MIVTPRPRHRPRLRAWWNARVEYSAETLELAKRLFPHWDELHEWIAKHLPRAAITVSGLANAPSLDVQTSLMLLSCDRPNALVILKMPDRADLQRLQAALMNGVSFNKAAA